jgi:hypothetical protein
VQTGHNALTIEASVLVRAVTVVLKILSFENPIKPGGLVAAQKCSGVKGIEKQHSVTCLCNRNATCQQRR